MSCVCTVVSSLLEGFVIAGFCDRSLCRLSHDTRGLAWRRLRHTSLHSPSEAPVRG